MKNCEKPKKLAPKKSDHLLNSQTKVQRALIYSRVSTQDQDAQNQVTQPTENSTAPLLTFTSVLHSKDL